MATLTKTLRSLATASRHAGDILVSQLLAFMMICLRIKNDILLIYPSTHQPHQTPPILPLETQVFLGDTCKMDLENVEACWRAVGDVVWAEDTVLSGVKDEQALQDTFNMHGGRLYRVLWPSTQVCINSECLYVKENKLLKLQRAVEHDAILYTFSMGPIPVRTHNFTCDGCGVVYHPDYFLKTEIATNERLRHYYHSEELPDVIQVATHHFVETKLGKMWANSMLYGWYVNSASNCARIYERSLMSARAIPSDWTVKANLRPEFVYDSFKIISILRYHQIRGSHFCVSQNIDQAYRFDSEMERINEEFREYGQPEVNHRCEKCVRTVLNTEGELCEVFAVVCDGVTVGRPCCGVPHCRGQLLSTRDAFCEEHSSKKSICRITGCERSIKSKNSKSCDLAEHQALEAKYRETEKAAFQLKLRYERSRKMDEEQNAIWDAGTEVLNTGSSAMFEAVVENGKGKKTAAIRAQFGRRRTHNEQLIIAPCGIILARETFYHSEAFSAVAKFVKDTFRNRRKPNHFIYDSNCILSKHVRKHKDEEMRSFFQDIGLAVDVFHFKCKHSEKDEYCGSECNPWKFPELMYVNENGEACWYFNTSIAEQTNVWFGRYHSMCREMQAIFYEFFLNTMILMYNEDKKNELELEGLYPTYWRTM
ncbi:hypothetical protein K435DRAFT_661838 [Dendrothele bispora CBS 962.96]|uniref:CxC6 like cysteine cluster associated with KDZ domain-containing protein n=1 Tax=Dendrothele bispora (strain CBS 962.96) TaxID=1314807 RepID=A0A4S8M7E3_DENBC|nr:hypothetical protein K435DRAFT_661838 [Dendrothele bispora CBS 962.96]